MNAAQARAFSRELSKSAAAPELLSRLWRSGIGRSVAGAGAGAGIGALASPGDRAGGALRGALLGGVGGYAAPLVTRAGRQKAKDAIKRFGAAQRYAITGRGAMPVRPGMGAAERASLAKAEEAGLTNIPGIVKGLAGKDRKKVLREAWRQSGKMGKLMGAADLAMTVPTVFDPNVEGGAAEKALGGIGSAGGYFLSSRMPLLGSALFASGTGTVGKYLGRGIDKLRGYNPPPTAAPAAGNVLGLDPSSQYVLDQSGLMTG